MNMCLVILISDLPHLYLDCFMIHCVTFPLVYVCLCLLFNTAKMVLVIGINCGFNYNSFICCSSVVNSQETCHKTNISRVTFVISLETALNCESTFAVNSLVNDCTQGSNDIPHKC